VAKVGTSNPDRTVSLEDCSASVESNNNNLPTAIYCTSVQLGPNRTPTVYVPHVLKGNSAVVKLAHTVGSYGVRILTDSLATLLPLLMQIIKEKLLDWISETFDGKMSEIQGDSKRWTQFLKSIFQN